MAVEERLRAEDELQAERWRAVLARDRGFDGAFVFAVRSTGVYCRPSCPARRPRRAQAVFFGGPAEAERAGFRACLRCRPRDGARDRDVEVVGRVCRRIEEGGPADERDLAALAGLSPRQLRRVFRRVAGVTPREFRDACRIARWKEHARAGRGVSAALYEAGYGSPSRLYERAGAALGMTPATYRRRGRGARIAFAAGPCALGRVLVAATEAGVCAIRLGDDDAALEAGLRAEFAEAEIRRDARALRPTLRAIAREAGGAAPHLDLPLDIRATAFERRVWDALRAIPRGETRSYGAIAKALGAPGAARAVGRACAANPVALAIPCHRAVRADGGLGGFRWGVARKRALLAREQRGTGKRR
jgi:AraC family transcriptional regulator of adaptative response/methylated-DNA-[protein]-cysteine methyltransferase